MSVRARKVIASVVTVAIACVCMLTMSRELFALRLVRASILLDRVLLFKGSIGDDGHRDADVIWRSLSDMNFRPTEEGDKWLKLATTERRLLKGQVTIDFSYGGKIDVPSCYLERHVEPDGQVSWMVNAVDVKDWFPRRSIPRSQVVYLKDINAER